MPLPFILGGLVGVGIAALATAVFDDDDVSSDDGVSSDDNVSWAQEKAAAQKKAKAQKKAIESAKNEIWKKIAKEIDSMLAELRKYKVKIKLQLWVSIVCLFAFCTSLFISNSLILLITTWLIAIVAAFMSMYLLAEIITLCIYKNVVKDFLRTFWRNWNKNKLKFTLGIMGRIARQSVRKAVHNRIKIRREVDKEISKLNFEPTYDASLTFLTELAYDASEGSRSHIARRIYRKAISEINYDDIMVQIKVIFKQIGAIAISYFIITSLLEVGVVELSGLGRLKWITFTWIALPTFFCTCFWWHKQQLLSDARNLPA